MTEAEVKLLMEARGFQVTSTQVNTKGLILSFRKTISESISLRAEVYVWKEALFLEISNVIGAAIILRTDVVPVDCKAYGNIEAELIDAANVLIAHKNGKPKKQKETSAPKKEQQTIEERALEFKQMVKQAGRERGYSSEMCKAFFEYWTSSKDGKKMFFETEPRFVIKLRLDTWKRIDDERAAKRTGRTFKSFEQQKAEQQDEENKRRGTNNVNVNDLD